METLACKFDLWGTNEPKYEFAGHAAVWGEVPFTVGPRGGTYLSKGAFKKTLTENNKVIMLWNHEVNEPIGSADVKEDNYGLFFRSKVNPDVQRGREVYSNINADIITEMSVGFEVLKEEVDSDAETRTIKEVKLFEISPVTFAANPRAQITEVHREAITPSPELEASIQAAVKEVLTNWQPQATLSEPGKPTLPEPQRTPDKSMTAILNELQNAHSKLEA